MVTVFYEIVKIVDHFINLLSKTQLTKIREQNMEEVNKILAI